MRIVPLLWNDRLVCALPLVAFCACAETSVVSPDDEATESFTSPESAPSNPSEEGSTGAEETGAEEDTSGEDDSESGETGQTDGNEDPTCDPSDPDACGEGLKCAPFVVDNRYAYARCVAFGDLGVADRCDPLDDADVYGGDTCGEHFYCDPDNNLDLHVGGCYPLCIFDEEGEGSCAAAGEACIVIVPGIFYPCVGTCVPGETDCGQGYDCLPHEESGNVLFCQPPP